VPFGADNVDQFRQKKIKERKAQNGKKYIRIIKRKDRRIKMTNEREMQEK